MTSEQLDALQALADAATPGPWLRGIKDDPAEGRAFVLDALDKGAGAVHLVCSQDGDKDISDECLIPALTGNGPTGPANAAFIAAARQAVPALIAEVKQRRGVTRWLAGEALSAVPLEYAPGFDPGSPEGYLLAGLERCRGERDKLRAENEAKDRVIERLRKERDDAVSHLVQVRRPLIPGGSRG